MKQTPRRLTAKNCIMAFALFGLGAILLLNVAQAMLRFRYEIQLADFVYVFSIPVVLYGFFVPYAMLKGRPDRLWQSSIYTYILFGLKYIETQIITIVLINSYRFDASNIVSIVALIFGIAPLLIYFFVIKELVKNHPAQKTVSITK